MQRALLAALIGSLFLAGTIRADDKKDQEPFQGKWKIAAIEVNGEKVDPEQFEKTVLIVKGDERVLKDGDEVKSRATYKVDNAKSPKTIDISVSEGTLKGKTLKGIYELKGDTMTINVKLEGEERPKDFSSQPGHGCLLQTFKRMKDK
jgi:uncharacterized protein (TIGR03067 family)